MSEESRLPAMVASCLDHVVRDFISQHQGMDAHIRYQDAHLWLIFREERSKSGKPAIVTRRVTIAAYSDDELSFMPDILITTSRGRYVPSQQVRVKNRRSIPLLKLQRMLFRNKTEEKAKTDIIKVIKKELNLAWKAAESLSEEDATELIP